MINTVNTGKLKLPLRERREALNHPYLGKHLLCVALYNSRGWCGRQQHRLGLPALPVLVEAKPSAQKPALLLPASQAGLQPGVQPVCQVWSVSQHINISCISLLLHEPHGPWGAVGEKPDAVSLSRCAGRQQPCHLHLSLLSDFEMALQHLSQVSLVDSRSPHM